jgi:hypothetical protein
MMMQMPKMASRQQSPQLACDAQGVVTLSQSLQPTIQQIKSNNLFFIFLIWMKKNHTIVGPHIACITFVATKLMLHMPTIMDITIEMALGNN